MRTILIAVLMVALTGCAAPGDSEQAGAGPAEVVAKVREAAALLAERGPEGIEVLRDRRSRFTWKDTYVFVVNCDADEVMANPVFPERQGGDIKQHTDHAGKQYGIELCETAMRPRGGWVEYVWPKREGGRPLRKISFVMSVDGLPYQLGAGIYNETITIEELNELTETRD